MRPRFNFGLDRLTDAVLLDLDLRSAQTELLAAESRSQRCLVELAQAYANRLLPWRRFSEMSLVPASAVAAWETAKRFRRTD